MNTIPCEILQIIMSYHGGLKYRKGEWVSQISREDERILMLENLLPKYKRPGGYGLQRATYIDYSYEYFIDLSTKFTTRDTPYRKYVTIMYCPHAQEITYHYVSFRIHLDSFADYFEVHYIRA